jgi:hypothetical protein
MQMLGASRMPPLVRVLQIVVPGDELRRFSSQEETSMKWLPLPQTEQIGAVTLFISQAAVKPDGWPGAAFGSELIGIAATRTRVAWLVYHRELYDDKTRSFLVSGRARFAAVPKESGLRGVIAGHGAGGERSFVEFAWQDSE